MKQRKEKRQILNSDAVGEVIVRAGCILGCSRLGGAKPITAHMNHAEPRLLQVELPVWWLS